MDWIDKTEQKKKVRRMASRMLWSDFRDMICSWKVLFFLAVYMFFFLLALIKEIDDFNVGACFYFIVWEAMALYALTENIFNYLPVSSKDIVYYLNHRTNLLITWILILYIGTAVLLNGIGVELFVERGIVSMVLLWSSVEWMHQASLFENSKGRGKLVTEHLTTGQKVRYCVYFAYSLILILVSMLYSMFMENMETAQIMAPVLLGAYIVLFFFRFDLMRWFSFDQYRQRVRRAWFSTPAQMSAAKEQ